MNIPPKYCLNPGCILDNRYIIKRYISSGGFGITYEALDNRLNTRVAIKELFSKGINDRNNSNVIILGNNESQFKALKKRFIIEAQRLCSLSHPNIVRVTDVFEANDTAYFVMDYIEGSTLSNTPLPLSEEVVRKYLDQILNAIKFIHERSILHLDIKPANIMLDRNDNIILIDFGASRINNPVNDNNDGLSNTTSYISYSPGYAPLEQVFPGKVELDTYTDIYALGATLYHLLIGRKPPMPNEINENGIPEISGISNEMKNAIAQALEPNATSRLFSVNQFRRALNGEIINVKDENQTRIKERAEAIQRRKNEDSLIEQKLAEQQRRRNEEARLDALKIWQERQKIENHKKHQEETLKKEQERRIEEDRKREMALRREFAERQKRLQENAQPNSPKAISLKNQPKSYPMPQHSVTNPPLNKNTNRPISLQSRPTTPHKPQKEHNAFVIAGTILAAIAIILVIMFYDNGDNNQKGNIDSKNQTNSIVDSTNQIKKTPIEKGSIPSKKNSEEHNTNNKNVQPNNTNSEYNKVDTYSSPNKKENISTPQNIYTKPESKKARPNEGSSVKTTKPQQASKSVNTVPDIKPKQQQSVPDIKPKQQQSVPDIKPKQQQSVPDIISKF